MTDPYRVLGVREDATQDEITAAYHRLARRYHPDAAEEAEPDRFRELVAAYTALRGHRRERQAPRRAEPGLRAGPVRYHGPPGPQPRCPE